MGHRRSFVINNNDIVVHKHDNYKFKQKIICFDLNDDEWMCDFTCTHNCWWYFVVINLNRNPDIKRLAAAKITNCPDHKKFIMKTKYV
jgi:hypothetical protein